MAEFRLPDIFGRYLRHVEINDYLEHLAHKYPDSVLVKTCGHTYEGRELKSIRITQPKATVARGGQTNASSCSTVRSGARSATQSQSSTKTRRSLRKRKSCSTKSGRTCKSASVSTSSTAAEVPANLVGRGATAKVSSTSKVTAVAAVQRATSAPPRPIKRPVVLIDGGIHAREWISVATALFCVHQLTENAAANHELLGKLDFVIVPVVNADGYEYTHTHSRFWRKTRQPVEGCKHVGADCNRNFDFQWSSACSRASRVTFRGVRPFSEPETNILKSIMHSLTDFRFYLTLHSHAQAIMYPWGYTRELPANWQELDRLARAGHAAIKRKTGKHYRTGSVSLLIKHTAAGGSPDYALGAVKIPYAMTMELSGGGHGFDPPCTEIRGLVRESWYGIRAMCAHVAQLE